MDAEHLSPAQAGRLSRGAGASRVVLFHYSGATNEDLAEIAEHFSGEIIAGEDLMRFEVAASAGAV